ncbi:hypothetical protein Esti_002522 [Eimeria stiedai]
MAKSSSSNNIAADMHLSMARLRSRRRHRQEGTRQEEDPAAIGLAGPRAASALSHSTRASEPQTPQKEAQSARSLRAYFSLPGSPRARELSTLRHHETDKANYHKRSLTVEQSPDDTINEGLIFSPTGSDPDNANKPNAAALAPRPKRRRVVSSHPSTQGAATETDHGRLRSQLLALTRKHLPLLGDLISPHLESLMCDTQMFLERPSLLAPDLDEISESEVQQGQAAIQLLKSASTFLLEAAGDSLGMILAEGRCTAAANPGAQGKALPSRDRSTRFVAKSSWKSCENLCAPPTPTRAGFSSHPQLYKLQELHGCKQRSQLQYQGQENQKEQQQASQQQEKKEVDEFALLRVLQHPSLPRSSWSHGVFFKYAFVDLDFECLVTFRICLCHHPLFIFYKEHEKGLHVLHVDGVFNPAGGGAHEKKELWKERLAYNYVCDPAVPFKQTSNHRESRGHQHSMQELEAAPADSGAGASSFRNLQSLVSDNRRTETWEELNSATVDRLESLLRDADVLEGTAAVQKGLPSSQEGQIKLCSARASLCLVSPSKASQEKLAAAPLLPHVGPQMTGSCDLFCLEMWAVLSLCRDQVSPPTLPQYVRALKRLWDEALSQQQRDIYDNIITPKYIARRLRTPDLTFEALPPWWQQQESSRFSEGG